MLLRIIETISSWSGWFSGIGVVIMAVVITIDVFPRYVFGKPLLFADDISVYCMIFITFVGAALTLSQVILVEHVSRVLRAAWSDFEPPRGAFRIGGPPHDPAAANALLDRVGYAKRDPDGYRRAPDGKALTLTLLLRTGAISHEVQTLWKKDMDAVGLRMEYRQTPFQDLFKDVALPMEKLMAARILYDRVDDHMKYDKSKPGWGRGDVEWACDSRFGNCTDFHSLFISLARAQVHQVLRRTPASAIWNAALAPSPEWLFHVSLPEPASGPRVGR